LGKAKDRDPAGVGRVRKRCKIQKGGALGREGGALPDLPSKEAK